MNDILLSTLKNVPIWIWLIFLIPILSRLFWKFVIVRPREIKSGINKVDSMNGKEFELFLKSLFEKKGYRVTRVGTSYSDHRGDFGGDLIIEKDGIKTAIQSKRNSNSTGIFGVREALGARDYYHCQNAIVVCNNNFTQDAITQAKASNIVLWNRNRLISEINQTEQN